MTAREQAERLLAEHAPVATGLGEWCCKCSPMEWRPLAHRAGHLAQALDEAGLLLAGEPLTPYDERALAEKAARDRGHHLTREQRIARFDATQPAAAPSEDVEALTDNDREALAQIIRWHAKAAGASEDGGYLSAGVQNVQRRVERFLAAHAAQVRADERRRVLTEAADRWQQGAWSDVLLPKPTPPAVPVIAYANRVGDWLRELAGRAGEEAMF